MSILGKTVVLAGIALHTAFPSFAQNDAKDLQDTAHKKEASISSKHKANSYDIQKKHKTNGAVDMEPASTADIEEVLNQRGSMGFNLQKIGADNPIASSPIFTVPSHESIAIRFFVTQDGRVAVRTYDAEALKKDAAQSPTEMVLNQADYSKNLNMALLLGSFETAHVIKPGPTAAYASGMGRYKNE